ncbi:aminoacyl-tRNA hydrolase [Candidatus Saccharibacteria bacterium]|nr:aminoacyl-tRNA hydrolase [Candidatus Saccharibacteria bacterium]
MKLILSQGNPGIKYSRTRHNVGFYIIDQFAAGHNLVWSEKSKFNALMAETVIEDEKILLVKPTTYYNETGISARKLIDFYTLDLKKDLLVIHDDLALPFGAIRTRKQGSDAGNNGVKSLNNHLGPDYHRIRIGINSELRDRMDDAEFVLSRFNKEESEQLDATVLPYVINHIEQFCQGSLEVTSHKSVAST